MINKKSKKNQGNSYIVVVATISFLSVLVAAILVAVALCYRLKAYDINARDNFYYLEQAMDEIYAGVGADSMNHLNAAYDETIEVIVYYDSKSKSYITMESDKANALLKDCFIKRVKEDANYANELAVKAHFDSFLSNPYDKEDNPSGVQLSVNNVTVDNNKSVTIHNVILKREAQYSTMNTRKNGGLQDTFVQTITTDLVISKPEFNVNFNMIGSELSDLYSFSMIADMGVEINNPQTKVNVTGNIYAAADFYNKDYNGTSTGNEITATDDANYKKVNSYSEDKLKECNGVNEKSMYSGIYIGGGDLVISAGKVIVPGSIAAMNGANLLIAGISQSNASAADIWADSIVLGGYSLLKDASSTSDETLGSVVSMRANCYMADDLEINAESSQFKLNGQYYGYNYASTDNRTYSDEFIKASKNRTFVDNTLAAIKDATTLEGQAHYNSSAIIVNGSKATLDLASVNAMYIAGQAYVELSKQTTTTSEVTDADGNVSDYTVTNRNGELEAVSVDTYDYKEAEVETKDGTTEYEDYYSVDSKGKESNIQDYRTGEAISIKSNQLAYIPPTAVVDEGGDLYYKVPSGMENLELFKDNWDDLSNIPVIKTVISGKKYYFFDFSTAATAKVKNKDVMNEFIAAYAKMFIPEAEGEITQGEAYGLTDITKYQYFKINSLTVNEDEKGEYNIYSNSAISVKNGDKITIKAKSSSIAALTQAVDNINENVRVQQGLAADDTSSAGLLSAAGDAATVANNITVKLQSQYKEMKWLLSAQSVDAESVDEAHKIDESDMTPINHFFNFDLLKEKGALSSGTNENILLDSGYEVWLNGGDVEIDNAHFSDGNVKGLVICKGDVTFSDDVKSFEGLIVSGGKIIVNGSRDFTANEEIIKSILRECYETMGETGNSNREMVYKIFRGYKEIMDSESSTGGDQAESLKSISAIQFEDILGFKNWTKNVD